MCQVTEICGTLEPLQWETYKPQLEWTPPPQPEKAHEAMKTQYSQQKIVSKKTPLNLEKKERERERWGGQVELEARKMKEGPPHPFPGSFNVDVVS